MLHIFLAASGGQEFPATDNRGAGN